MTVAEFNLSVEDYADALYRFILGNIKDKDKARDIIQDTFEKTWVRIEHIQYENIKSYLFSTAYHTMIDMIRKEKRLTKLDGIPMDEYATSAHYSDLNEILHQAIDKLPEAQKAVIMLRDYEGYSYQEIGEITGLTEAQVKVYIYRGRIFLKNYIGKLETVL
jgi:RNA polymerase sigma factor (sigma-70 family)